MIIWGEYKIWNVDHKGAPIIITYKYKDAKKAIEWLCQAFGFQEKVIHEENDGSIAHAQLVFDQAMIMVSSEKDNDYDRLLKHPHDVEGYNTCSPYIVVKEIEEHYQNAVKSGAEICMALTKQDYGGALYTCKDPEGFLWNFGSYDPWKE